MWHYLLILLREITISKLNNLGRPTHSQERQICSFYQYSYRRDIHTDKEKMGCVVVKTIVQRHIMIGFYGCCHNIVWFLVLIICYGCRKTKIWLSPTLLWFKLYHNMVMWKEAIWLRYNHNMIVPNHIIILAQPYLNLHFIYKKR